MSLTGTYIGSDVNYSIDDVIQQLMYKHYDDADKEVKYALLMEAQSMLKERMDLLE